MSQESFTTRRSLTVQLGLCEKTSHCCNKQSEACARNNLCRARLWARARTSSRSSRSRIGWFRSGDTVNTTSDRAIVRFLLHLSVDQDLLTDETYGGFRATYSQCSRLESSKSIPSGGCVDTSDHSKATVFHLFAVEPNGYTSQWSWDYARWLDQRRTLIISNIDGELDSVL